MTMKSYEEPSQFLVVAESRWPSAPLTQSLQLVLGITIAITTASDTYYVVCAVNICSRESCTQCGGSYWDLHFHLMDCPQWLSGG